MAINGWEMTPEAVEVVLNRVQEEATEISGAIGDDVFADLSEGLITESGGAPVNGITGQVPMAINNLMNDQAGDLRAIFDRISAGIWGVVGITTEFIAANEEMATQALTNMQSSADTGDLTPFTAYGYEAPGASTPAGEDGPR